MRDSTLENKQILSRELWDRGRLWEIFGFTNGSFTALELAAEYSRLIKLYKNSPKEKQALEDAFAILNAPLTRRFYEGCRAVMRHIESEVGDSRFAQVEGKIWADLWGRVSERWQAPPDEIVHVLVEKYRTGEDIRLDGGTSRGKRGVVLVLAGIAVLGLIVMISVFKSPTIPTSTSPDDVTTINLIFEDDFSDPGSGWSVDSDEIGRWVYEGGGYRLIVKKANWIIWGKNGNLDQLDDFVLEVGAKSLSPENDNSLGIIFRAEDSDNFYLFRICPLYGSYTVEKESNGEWSTLKDWTVSSYIYPGTATNHLKVACQGSWIRVYVNDQKLISATDHSFSKGYVGLAASSGSSSDADGFFDNLKIYTPD